MIENDTGLRVIYFKPHFFLPVILKYQGFIDKTMSSYVAVISILYTVAISIGLFLSLIIFLSRKGNTRSNKYLSLLILIFSILQIWEFLTQSRLILNMPHMIMVLNPLVFLLGPLILFYVLALTSVNWKFQTYSFFHFIPVLVSYIIFIPVYLLDENEKIQIINKAFSNHSFIVSPVFYSAAILQILVYLVFSIKKLHEHYRNIKKSFSFTEYISLNWLRNLLIVFVVLWIAFAMRIFFGSKLVWGISASLSLLTMYFVGYFGYNQPVIFNDPEEDLSILEGKEVKKKYASSSLSESETVEYLKKIKMMMEEQKAFLKNDLKLGDLANQVNLPVYYVSQIINEGTGRNFYDFINEYRVNEVKKRIADRQYDNLTLLAIGYESGFNSKTAFYSAFKKHTGLTPADYKNNLLSRQ